jgi:hypothetical protein
MTNNTMDVTAIPAIASLDSRSALFPGIEMNACLSEEDNALVGDSTAF